MEKTSHERSSSLVLFFQTVRDRKKERESRVTNIFSLREIQISLPFTSSFTSPRFFLFCFLSSQFGSPTIILISGISNSEIERLSKKIEIMSTELLEIQPSELKFPFELKKQSSCLIKLINKSDHYVAFKVKTTSPKKYCVRPNTGIMKPKATCDFTVTMLAQRTAPPDLHCKDKFLVQGTIIPFGTSEEDITSDMFVKDSGKHIEEMKLKVFLVSPTQSPVLSPINGELKLDSNYEISIPKDRLQTGVENIPPSHEVAEDDNAPETSEEKDELSPVDNLVDISPPYQFAERIDACEESNVHRAAEDVTMRENENAVAEPVEDIETITAEGFEDQKPVRNAQKLNLTNDFEGLKSKLTIMDAELQEAEATIMKLKQEKSVANQEREKLKHELEILRRTGERSAQVGFPLLYVLMVAFVSLVVGYFIHL